MVEERVAIDCPAEAARFRPTTQMEVVMIIQTSLLLSRELKAPQTESSASCPSDD